MPQARLVLVEGIYQGFENLPDEIDAIYYYSPFSVHVMLFDKSLERHIAAQKILREHLQRVIQQKLNDSRCAGLIRPANTEWTISLADLGIQLVTPVANINSNQNPTRSAHPYPLAALPPGRKIEMPPNPRFGTISGDTTPFPEFARLSNR